MGQTRCMNCMGLIEGNAASCPHCGYGQNAEQSTFGIKPGTILKGKYLVGRILGQGGFGITYVGYDLTLDVKVAIKEYFPMGCATRNYTISNQIQWNTTQFSKEQWQQGSESFLKEARRLAKLDSLPSIVRVKDTFPENQTSYIIMEYIEGETLKECLKKTGTMSMQECIALLTPLMESLARMHEKGLIHRDISPDNIMIMPDGNVCLLDFGAAKDLSYNQTLSSQQVAKKGFSPPEQYRERGKIGSWTDVYALCATIYYCVTGKMVPDAMDRAYEDTLDIAGLKGSVGEAEAAALADGLKLHSEERIQTVTELLGRFKENATATSESLTETDAPIVPVAAKKSKKKIVIASAVCAVLFLMLVALFSGGGDTEETAKNDSGSSDLNESTALFTNTLMADAVDDSVNEVFYGTVLGSKVERSDICSITFLDALNEMPDTAWDVSWDQDGTVMAWTKQNAGNEKYYDLFIGAEGGVKAKDCYRLFAGYHNVEKIVFQSCFDTSRVENMEYMFSDCTKLKEIDAENLNTEKVTKTGWMFWHCESLTTLDLSGFDTSETENMRSMFNKCKSLEKLDISGFDTQKVTNMAFMFNDCEKLVSLDLKNFETSQVTNMERMFRNCLSLTSLDVSSFDTSLVQDMKSMFYGCKNLEELDVSSFDTQKVTDMSYMFNDCEMLTSLNLSNFNTSQVTNMQSLFQYCINLKELDISRFDTSKVTDMSYMFNQCLSLTSLDVSSFQTDAATDMKCMFQLCGSLKELDLSGFHISEGADKTDMLNDCAVTEKEAGISLNKNVLMKEDKLQAIKDAVLAEKYNTGTENVYLGTVLGSDISRDSIVSVIFTDTLGEMPDTAWDVSMGQDGTVMAWVTKNAEHGELYDLFIGAEGGVKGQRCSWLFAGYYNVEAIQFNHCFDTEKATDMEAMFLHCTRLKSLDADQLKTGAVTDMGYMFLACRSLASLDASGFDTDAVTDMVSMFNLCDSLTQLDVSGFDTGAVADMQYMFNRCESLTQLDVNGFDTNQVTNMQCMFNRCSNLEELDVSNFDTGKVTAMGWMFNRCESLTQLNVSGFDTGTVADMQYMFHNCANLITLDVSNFTIGKETNVECMFDNCGITAEQAGLKVD